VATEIQRIAEHGVLTLEDAVWERARQRMDVIGPIAALDLVCHQAADNAAHSLSLSRRQVYVLIRRARQDSGLVTDLARSQSSDSKGKGSLSEPVKLIIREACLQKSKFRPNFCYIMSQKNPLHVLH